jgi:hypothetical protein
MIYTLSFETSGSDEIPLKDYAWVAGTGLWVSVSFF